MRVLIAIIFVCLTAGTSFSATPIIDNFTVSIAAQFVGGGSSALNRSDSFVHINGRNLGTASTCKLISGEGTNNEISYPLGIYAVKNDSSMICKVASDSVPTGQYRLQIGTSFGSSTSSQKVFLYGAVIESFQPPSIFHAAPDQKIFVSATNRHQTDTLALVDSSGMRWYPKSSNMVGDHGLVNAMFGVIPAGAYWIQLLNKDGRVMATSKTKLNAIAIPPASSASISGTPIIESFNLSIYSSSDASTLNAVGYGNNFKGNSRDDSYVHIRGKSLRTTSTCKLIPVEASNNSVSYLLGIYAVASDSSMICKVTSDSVPPGQYRLQIGTSFGITTGAEVIQLSGAIIESFMPPSINHADPNQKIFIDTNLRLSTDTVALVDASGIRWHPKTSNITGHYGTYSAAFGVIPAGEYWIQLLNKDGKAVATSRTKLIAVAAQNR